MGETTGQAAVPTEPGSGFEKTILEKGWATPEQIVAGRKHQAEKKAAGETLTFPQAMVSLNILTKDQVREALGGQDKVSMRCPTCRKVYTIWGYKPGSKTSCKNCKVALIPTGDTAAAIQKEAGAGTALADAVVVATPAPAIPVAPLAPVTPAAPEITIAPLAGLAQPTVPVGPPIDPALANLVAGYKIERCVGSGAMGDVYLAQQTSMDRPVALKLLPPELAKNPEFVTRFMSEARSAGKLSHENIVAAVDVGESNGRYYFVMEYINGLTLQDVLKRDGKLPEKRAFDIARQIANGLRHAHAQGFIHRDIKPANIMIASEKVAKICDFGLARQVDSDVTLTIPGTVQSSPAYASPEQCRGRRDLDHRTDMYSLGVTLFEMLTGRRPFLADTPGALFIKHATETPPSPQSLNPSLTAAANQMVLRLLKKEPKQRFDSYDQLIEAIDAVQNPKKLQQAKATRRMAARPVAKWRAPAIGVAAAVLLLGGAGFLYSKLSKPAPPPPAKELQAKTTTTLDPEVEKLIKGVAAMENRAAEDPSQIAAVRARWKELVEQFKGTPALATLARRQQDFEQRVADLADTAARKLMADAVERANAGRLAEGVTMLREYPSAYENTPAATQVTAQLAEIEKVLEDKYRQEREKLLVLIAAGKIDEARAALAPLKSLVSMTDAEGHSDFVRGDWGNEAVQLAARVEELAKGDKPAPAALPGKPDGQALVVGKPVPVEKGPPPPTPDFVVVLRNPALRADPAARSRAAGNFRTLAARSALCRAAEVFLMHEDRFWKLAGDASPLTKAFNDYLATLPLERADSMSTAEHTGFFVSLAKKISELGDATPKDVLYMFLMAHADGLLAQNVRPDGEGIRLAKLQGAKAADFWGPAASVNRLALSRLVIAEQVTAIDLRRAIDPLSKDIDFPSRLLCALALLRDKEFEPVAASASWKRLAGMMPDSSQGKWCDEVAERLKKASICDGCNGAGKYACKKCMAAGMADCDKCKGSGRVPEAAEPGFVSRYTVPCPICKQKGKVICPTCQGGRVQKCEKCEGKKTRKTVSGAEYIDVVGSKLCSPCGGTGNIFQRVGFPCPDCDGLGRAFPK